MFRSVPNPYPNREGNVIFDENHENQENHCFLEIPTFRTPPESVKTAHFPETDRERGWFFDKMAKITVFDVFLSFGHILDTFWTPFRPIFMKFD